MADNNVNLVVLSQENFSMLLHSIKTLEQKVEEALSAKPPEYMAEPRVMEMMGVSQRTLRRYRKDGQLSYIRHGKKKIYYKYEDIRKLMENNRIKSWKR